ncbi:MAG: PAS domain-containing protein, partial [Terriglobia bacterium]
MSAPEELRKPKSPHERARRRPAATRDPFTESAILEALMEHMPDNIYVKDVEGRFIKVNRCVTGFLGVNDASEIIGKTDFDFFKPDHAEAARTDEEEVMRTGTPIIGKEERETWPGQPDTWASTTKIPFRDEAGNVVGIVGISRDITRGKRAEEALAQAHGELQRQVRSKTAQLSAQNDALLAEIAERKRAEEELLREKSHLDALMDHL